MAHPPLKKTSKQTDKRNQFKIDCNNCYKTLGNEADIKKNKEEKEADAKKRWRRERSSSQKEKKEKRF